MALKKHQLRKLRQSVGTAPATGPAAPGRDTTAQAPAYDYVPNPAQAALFHDPAAFIRRFLPQHSREAFNPMHRYSFAQYQRQHAQPLPHRDGTRLAIAAPRGAAKSTIHTLLFPLMDLLSGRERHQVIISGTMAQSKNRILTINNELRNNPHIRATFFGGKMPRYKSNTRTIELGNCRIEAYSAGSEMRGISHGEYRPTRIILDDVEQSRLATKSYHRARLRAWYDEVVENLGDTYTHITIVGTILHTDSLLSDLLNRPGFKSETYKSIIQWDNAPDLWRTWQKLFTNRQDPDAVETAKTYFKANRDAMLKDTKVFWPEKEPYQKLQEKLLILGRSAFFKEKQNTPIKDHDQIFDTTLWTRFNSPNELIQTVTHSLTLDDASLGTPISRLAGHTQPQPTNNPHPSGIGSTTPINPILPINPIATPTTGSPEGTNSSIAPGETRGKQHEILPDPEGVQQNPYATRPGRPTQPTQPRGEAAPQSVISNSELVIASPPWHTKHHLRYYGFLDPALGKPTTRDGDYAAIVTVGKAPDNTLYVIDVFMEKVSPQKQIEHLFALNEKYNYQAFGFEANGFQETLGTFIKQEQQKRKNAGRPWRIPIKKFTNTHSKHSRIALLEPHIIAGSIQFQQDLPQSFYVQADEYNARPTNHDDALDALASCVEMIRQSQPTNPSKIISTGKLQSHTTYF